MLVFVLAVLASVVVPAAAAGPSWGGPYTGGPGPRDNCNGISYVAQWASDQRNFDIGEAWHACD